MSVSFDVLDSLYSIRNVEDLKKRWAKDREGFETPSYKAVELFYSYFRNEALDSSDFIMRIAQFSMCYRWAVRKGLCPKQEQTWIMPYIRYAECLKSFIVHGNDTQLEKDEFALRMREDFIANYAHFNEHIEIFEKIEVILPDFKKNCFTNVKQCEEAVQLFERLVDIINELGGYDDNRYFWLTQMCDLFNADDNEIKNNPWDQLSDSSDYTCESIWNDACEDFATISSFYGVDLAYYPEAFPDSMGNNWVKMLKNCSPDKLSTIRTGLKNLQDIELVFELADFVKDMSLEDFSTVRTEFKTRFIGKYKDELIKMVHAFMNSSDESLIALQKIFAECDSFEAMSELADLPKRISEFNKSIGKELEKFNAINIIIGDKALSSREKLDKISSLSEDGFQWNFEIILQYQLERIFVEYIKEFSSGVLQSSEVIIREVLDLVKECKNLLPSDFFVYLVDSLTDALEVVEIRMQERQKVLFEMSHSIKNLVASVSEPLTMLQDELSGTQRRTVENALAGASLIRDLAVGVHMSMRGEAGAWRKDVKEPGFGATTLDKIILDAMRHAVSNMFDGKYFSIFVRNYFGRDLETFMQAQNEWKTAETAKETFACINKYFFDFKIDCHDTDLKVAVGDRDGTATKLLILFQELFLNAVKYSSFSERAKRFVKLDINITADEWDISVSNSAVERKTVKSSGIGLSVIKNFATLFDAAYNATFATDMYTATMKFFLNK